MFKQNYETLTISIKDSTDFDSCRFAFVKSHQIQAFPCSRRRSSVLSQETFEASQPQGTRIPFDPEARLNTEANNRKHSSLNGFTQTYLSDWAPGVSGHLNVVLAGYLFNIKLNTANASSTSFGNTIAHVLATGLSNGVLVSDTTTEKSVENIYVNIILEQTPLLSVTDDFYYSTHVLSGLVNSSDTTALDLVISATENSLFNYYFSGLAFSSEPLTRFIRRRVEQVEQFPDDDVFTTYEDYKYLDSEDTNKVVVSLQILKKDATGWHIYEPAKLPKIKHGDIEDSVVLNHLTAENDVVVENNVLIKNDLAVESNAIIENDLVVENYLETKTLEVSERSRTKDQEVTGEAIINQATIQNLISNTISAPEICAEALYQKMSEQTMQVPIMTLTEVSKDNKTYHQLKILRIGTKPTTQE